MKIIYLSSETKRMTKRHRMDNFRHHTRHAFEHLRIAAHSAHKLRISGYNIRIPQKLLRLVTDMREGKYN